MKEGQYTQKHMSDSQTQAADAVDIRFISEIEFQQYFEQIM